MGQIKIKDHLSPAEAEVGAELGNFLARPGLNPTTVPVEAQNKIEAPDHTHPELMF